MIKISEYTVPGDLPGRKIALVSDLHDRDGAESIAIMREQSPDIIAIVGDLPDGNRVEYVSPGFIIDKAVDFLRECVKIAPTYYSMGNHEWFLREEEFERIAETGAKVLDNAYLRVDADLLIGGLTSARVMERRAWAAKHPGWEQQNLYFHRLDNVRKKKRQWKKPKGDRLKRQNEYLGKVLDTAWLEDFQAEKGYKILLCHHPEYWAIKGPMLKRRNIDLTLSGHAHGGQWRIFGRSIFAPGQGMLPKYAGGLYEEDGRRLIVSRGLSNTVRVPRIGNPREMVMIHLGGR